MSLEDDVARDLRRARRWESAHAGFLAVVSLLVAAAVGAFWLYREWVIWR